MSLISIYFNLISTDTLYCILLLAVIDWNSM